MNVRYRVELSQAERGELTTLLSGGKHAVRKLKRAQILLAADAGASDDDIVTSVGVGGSTVYRTKRRFVLGNLEAALSEEPRAGAARKLSGKEEALLVATACSSPLVRNDTYVAVIVNMGTVEIKRNQTTSLPRSVHGVGPVGAMGRILPRPITRGAPRLPGSRSVNSISRRVSTRST